LVIIVICLIIRFYIPSVVWLEFLDISLLEIILIVCFFAFSCSLHSSWQSSIYSLACWGRHSVFWKYTFWYL